MWAPVLIVELFANLGMIAVAIVLLVLFFQRRSSAPRVYIAFMVAAPAVAAASLWAQSALPGITVEAADIAALVKACVSSTVWIAYFVFSIRVKNTFVERRRKEAMAPPPPAAMPPPPLVAA
jgi:hypothetical protein